MTLPAGTRARVHYIGTLQDGTEFDSSRGREPLEFTIGAGEVLPGFEQAVIELEIGSSTVITLSAEAAYGPHQHDALQSVPITAFFEPPEVGAVAHFVGPEGQALAATITEVTEEDAVLDFNHPLAGHDLTFSIELVEIVNHL